MYYLLTEKTMRGDITKKIFNCIIIADNFQDAVSKVVLNLPEEKDILINVNESENQMSYLLPAKFETMDTRPVYGIMKNLPLGVIE